MKEVIIQFLPQILATVLTYVLGVIGYYVKKLLVQKIGIEK